MTAQFQVLPLSPARTWAICWSGTFTSGLEHRDDGFDLGAVDQRRPDADDFAGPFLMGEALAGHPDPGDGRPVDLASDLRCLLPGLGAARDAHDHLVRLRPALRRERAVDGVDAQEVDA